MKLFLRNIIGANINGELVASMKSVWGRRASGTLLLFMYGLVFYIVMMSLTAYQIQTRVHAIGNLTIWNVARTADEIFRLQKTIDEQLILNSDLEEQLSSMVRAENDANLNYWVQRDALVIELLSIDPEIHFSEEVKYGELLSIAKKYENTNKVSGSLKGLEEFGIANSAYMQESSNKQALGKIYSAAEIRTQVLKDDLQTKIAGIPNYSKIIELTDELRFFYYPPNYSNTSWIGGIYTQLFGGITASESNQLNYSFVTLPSEVLIILIVIAMGTMGSLINITQIFFAGEDKTITFYLFRPLLGAVVAIGVYVITKAGVLVSSNVGVGEVAALNAFFVSFISLVAGLMSENAINSIKNSGVRFLSGDNVTDNLRYANGVAKAMEQEGKKNEDLYPYFQHPPQEVDKWLTEKELVPGDAQRVIAAWLEEPVRNLFSDLRPQENGQQKKLDVNDA